MIQHEKEIVAMFFRSLILVSISAKKVKTLVAGPKRFSFAGSVDSVPVRDQPVQDNIPKHEMYVRIFIKIGSIFENPFLEPKSSFLSKRIIYTVCKINL